jgi:hypothetical protein
MALPTLMFVCDSAHVYKLQLVYMLQPQGCLQRDVRKTIDCFSKTCVAYCHGQQAAKPKRNALSFVLFANLHEASTTTWETQVQIFLKFMRGS